jgi:hypothetical protein
MKYQAKVAYMMYGYYTSADTQEDFRAWETTAVVVVFKSVEGSEPKFHEVFSSTSMSRDYYSFKYWARENGVRVESNQSPWRDDDAKDVSEYNVNFETDEEYAKFYKFWGRGFMPYS